MIDLTKLHEHDKFLLFEMIALHALILDQTRANHDVEDLAADACNFAEAMVVERTKRQGYRDGGCGV